MKIAFYDTSLSDAQWIFIEPMLPKAKKLGRPCVDRRCILDAVLYVAKGGIQWRLLPKDFPSWKTVYHVFRKWTLDHTWESLNAGLRAQVRGTAGKRSRPTAAVLDSQTVNPIHMEARSVTMPLSESRVVTAICWSILSA